MWFELVDAWELLWWPNFIIWVHEEFEIDTVQHMKEDLGMDNESESVIALSMQGWHIPLHPLIQNLCRYFSWLKWVYPAQTLTSTEHHISSQNPHFCVQLGGESLFLLTDKNR